MFVYLLIYKLAIIIALTIFKWFVRLFSAVLNSKETLRNKKLLLRELLHPKRSCQQYTALAFTF